MNLQGIDICMCQHDFQDHFLDPDGQIDYEDGQVCYLCYVQGDDHKFKLNNLEYLKQKYDLHH